MDSKRRESKWAVGDVLGNGLTGEVREAVRRGEEKKFAVKIVDLVALTKVFDKYGVTSDTVKANLLREIEVMGRLEHGNIVSLEETVWTNTKLYIFMERVEGRSLYEVIPQHGLCEDVAKGFFFQLCSAVAYCHAHNVIHGDLKIENILIRERDNRLKLIDFGFSHIVQPGVPMQRLGGTTLYAPPDDEEMSFSFDDWACGVILFAMLTCTLPFREVELFRAKQLVLNVPLSVSDGAVDILVGLLTPDATKRESVSEVMVSAEWLASERKRDIPHIHSSITHTKRMDGKSLPIARESSMVPITKQQNGGNLLRRFLQHVTGNSKKSSKSESENPHTFTESEKSEKSNDQKSKSSASFVKESVTRESTSSSQTGYSAKDSESDTKQSRKKKSRSTRRKRSKLSSYLEGERKTTRLPEASFVSPSATSRSLLTSSEFESKGESSTTFDTETDIPDGKRQVSFGDEMEEKSLAHSDPVSDSLIDRKDNCSLTAHNVSPASSSSSRQVQRRSRLDMTYIVSQLRQLQEIERRYVHSLNQLFHFKDMAIAQSFLSHSEVAEIVPDCLREIVAIHRNVVMMIESLVSEKYMDRQACLTVTDVSCILEAALSLLVSKRTSRCYLEYSKGYPKALQIFRFLWAKGIDWSLCGLDIQHIFRSLSLPLTHFGQYGVLFSTLVDDLDEAARKKVSSAVKKTDRLSRKMQDLGMTKVFEQ